MKQDLFVIPTSEGRREYCLKKDCGQAAMTFINTLCVLTKDRIGLCRVFCWTYCLLITTHCLLLLLGGIHGYHRIKTGRD